MRHTSLIPRIILSLVLAAVSLPASDGFAQTADEQVLPPRVLDDDADDDSAREAALEALRSARQMLRDEPAANPFADEEDDVKTDAPIAQAAETEQEAPSVVSASVKAEALAAPEQPVDVPEEELRVALEVTIDEGDDDVAEALSSQERASLERVLSFLELVASGPNNESVVAVSRVSNNDHPLSAGVASLRHLRDRFVGGHWQNYEVLQPYVTHPKWAEAIAQLEDNKCREALKTATDILGPPEVHTDGEPAIAYIFARMQMCAGQESQGRATLRKLAEENTAIGELSRRRLGMGASLSVAEDDEAMRLSQIVRAAQDQARRGQVDEALKSLRDFRENLSGSWDRYRVRLAEAKILEDAGRVDEAAQVYLGIYRMGRAWRNSEAVVKEVEDAEKRLKRTIIPFGDRLDRIHELVERGQYRLAQQVSRENVAMRGVSGDEVRGWTLYRQALENERERRREQAATQFEQADKLIKDPEMRPRLYFGWARALRRVDRDREAIALYERICDEAPQNPLCDEALYEAGRLLQFLNEHERAREKFFLVVAMHPFSSHVPDALWRFALSAYLQGDYEAAIPPLKDIVAHYGDQKDSSELTIGLKARYWIGTSYLKAGNRAMAARWLQETINNGTLTWYGRLAVARMEDAGMKPAVRLPSVKLTAEDLRDLSTLRIPQNPRMAVTSELVRLGLNNEALREVRNQIGVHPIPEGAQRLRAALHLVNGEPNWAHWLMKAHIDESGPTYATVRDWGTAFPVDYMELSHRFGNQFGVSPFLVQAIIRQESGFRPNVSSPVGAMGLMQLMPGTARYTSRVFLEDRSLTNAQIFNPETNVRLGTMYIRVHTAHAADMIPLALAGYNAGPAPLRSWFERYGDREVDAWVESITYREARGYVRKVMTSYITYAGLYGDGTLPDIPLKMPETLRRWGTIPEVAKVVEGEPVSFLLIEHGGEYR
jgi:soluble lytic murein transglycosylase